MLLLIIGLVLFFAIHSISIINVAWRDSIAQRLGVGPWRVLYSLMSLAGLVVLIWGYGIAGSDPVILYTSPDWLRHINFLLMLFVFPLFVATYLPGRIKTVTKHPTFTGIKIWAFAHLLVNGTLADVLLFGCFLAWAVAGRISMKRREQRPLSGMPATAYNDLVAVVVGLGLYALFMLFLHRWLTGIPLVA